MATTRKVLSVIEGGAPEGADDDLVPAIRRYVESVAAPLREQIILLQAEVEHLKAQPSPPPGRDGLPGCPGPAGRDGAPGKDGLGFDDLAVDFDGERAATFKFSSGERTKTLQTIVIPAMIYREVYRPDVQYERGDCVTWGGNCWVARAPTSEKPGAGATAWKLAVKAGRDGKAGESAYDIAVRRGFKGSEDDWLKSLRGPEGRPGRDLRHLA